MQTTSILVGLQSRPFSFEFLEYGALYEHGGGCAPGARDDVQTSILVRLQSWWVGFEFLEHGALF